MFDLSLVAVRRRQTLDCCLFEGWQLVVELFDLSALEYESCPSVLTYTVCAAQDPPRPFYGLRGRLKVDKVIGHPKGPDRQVTDGSAAFQCLFGAYLIEASYVVGRELLPKWRRIWEL